VDDPLLVGHLQGDGDLVGERENFVERERTARKSLRQVFALDQLQYEHLFAIVAFDAVDGGDVGVIQRCQQSGFAFEASEAVWVCGKRVGQKFQRDVAGQLVVTRAVHLAHATGTDFVDYVVVCDSSIFHKTLSLGYPNVYRKTKIYGRGSRRPRRVVFMCIFSQTCLIDW